MGNKFDALAQEDEINNGKEDNMANTSSHGRINKGLNHNFFWSSSTRWKTKRKGASRNQNNKNSIVESVQYNLIGTEENGKEQDIQEKEISSVEFGDKSTNMKGKS